MFRLSHHNVYALVVLKEKRTGKLAVVISTHVRSRVSVLCFKSVQLFWGGAPHWNKQLQIMQATLVLDEVAAMYPQDPLPSLFFCGDFNSTPPPHETGLYLFLHNGTLPKDNIIWTMNNERKELADASPAPTHKLAPRVKLASTYGLMGREPEYTHSSHGFAKPIDFIYCTPSTVRALEVLNVFDKKEMPHGMPMMHYGGDHICMCARFAFL